MSGPMPAGSPRVSARGKSLIAASLRFFARTFIRVRIFRASPAIFNHRALADFVQIGLRRRLVFLRKHLFTHFLSLRRVDGGRLAAAQRHHFDTLLGHLRRGQVADRGIVEQLAQVRRNVGGGPDHHFADRGIRHRLEILVGLLAGFHAAAQGLGILLPQLDRAWRGPVRHDQHDRLHPVFERVGLLRIVAAFGLDLLRDVLLADLQAFLVAAANQAAPDHVGLDLLLQRLGADALGLQRFGELLRRDPHPLAHLPKGLIDVGGAGVDAEFLGFLDLHLLVDQLVDHFLAARLLVGRDEVELGTLLDVEVDFDIEQRSKLDFVSTHKKPSRQEVIYELIDEKVKIKEAKKFGVDPGASDIDQAFGQMGQRMRVTPEQLTKSLEAQGIRAETLKQKIKTDMVWGSLVRGRYKERLQVGEKDVAEKVKAEGGDDAQQANAFEYRMQPVVLIVPHGSTPSAIELRQKDAE